jgi:NAD(P)-dependent dehydrogenase (short-subunit alcohol dehydrogenase family)
VFLVVGSNSEIGSATARLIRARGGKVIATTRRPPVNSNEVLLDFSAPVENFVPPEGIRSACIFVAVTRLAACEVDPAGSAYINVRQTIALVDSFAAQGIYGQPQS